MPRDKISALIQQQQETIAKMPRIGLGTYLLENTPSQPSLVADTITAAIVHAGYRRIDCAPVYFNEDAIGDALANILSSSSETSATNTNIPRRQDLFLVSKLPSPFHTNVEAAVRKSLLDLRIDYLDLYLIHWPVAFREIPNLDLSKRGWENQEIDDSDNGRNIIPHSIHDTWQQMERVLELGLVKAIGVANFPIILLHELKSRATIPPAVNQVECHPYLQQTPLLRYCQRQNIAFQAYSPLGTPGYKESHEPNLLQDSTLQAIAQKHDVSTAQVCLTWALQRSNNISVVVKASQKQHLIDNISILKHTTNITNPTTTSSSDDPSSSNSLPHFVLSETEMQQIASLDRRYRFFRPEDWWGEAAMAVFD
jgi:diketogulonate reductase-like aldo/keto reductase